jgi:methanogenic corrinoid protein MtbC1
MLKEPVDGSVAPGIEEVEGTRRSSSWSDRWRGKPGCPEVVVPNERRCRLETLVNLIEEEAIPRLVLNERVVAPVTEAEGTAAPGTGPQFIAEFVGLLLTNEIEAASRYIDAARVRGVSLSSIYLELLAPAARVLGRMWEEDTCSFADVTVALCRLHELLRSLSASHPHETETSPAGRRILLVPTPGEQHTFGLMMVTDMFRRTGWDVWSEAPHTREELLGFVRHEWFTIIGLSVGCEVHLDGVASVIHDLRKASRNRAVGVMVGGALFAQRPELALRIGADATGRDGREAAVQAENLVGMFARRS